MSADTIFRLFETAARRDADAIALSAAGGAISYGQLHDEIAGASRALGKARDDGPVILRAGDARTLLVHFFAAAAIGRPAMPLDPDVPDSLLAAAGKAQRSAGPADAREFYWGLTSGTTGEPKLFARSHRSWIASFEAAETVFSFPPRSRILIPGPMHHSLFLYGAVHALCRGHTAILPGPFRANRMAGAAAEATHLYAVPFMLGEMLKARLQVPRLRAIFCGGDKLPAELRRDCERSWPDADLVEFYGASETSFVTFHSTQAPAPEGSVGRPFPGVRIELRGEGEVFVSSPMLFARYVGEAPAGPWFSAGDMGYLDEAGCLHLTGRANRMIKSKGLKIHPEAIEAALAGLPEVRRAAVVGLPDPVRGAVAVAAIEFAGDAALPRHALAAHCREVLGARYCPRGYFAVDRLPATRSGKVAAAEVREALLARHDAYREIR